MRTDIRGPVEGLTLFPSPDDVFVPEQAGLARYLDPLVTIDLALVNPAWSGRVHLLSPVEPVDGHVGEDAEDHWTDLVRENWLGFALEGDRYRFLAAPEYFRHARLAADPRVQAFPDMQNPPPREAVREFHQARRAHEAWTELEEHYAAERESLAQAKAHQTEHGTLCMVPLREPHVHQDLPVLEQLGGTASARENWVEAVDFPVEIDDDAGEDGAAWPVGPDGERFELVAAVPGYHYRRTGAGSILLFFEPASRTVLLTFDWS